MKHLRPFHFIALVVVIIVPIFMSVLSRTQKKYGHIDTYEWVASNFWLESAKCMKKTGVWLAFEESGELIRFEEFRKADDPGHALVLGLMSKIFDRDMRIVDIVHLNAYINLIGLLGLLAYFYVIKRPLIMSIFLLIAPIIFFRGLNPAPHINCMGLVAMLFLLPLGIIGYHYKWLKSKSALTFVLLGVIGLAFTTLFRGVLGLLGLGMGLGTLLTVFMNQKKLIKQTIIALALAILIVFSWLSPSWVTLSRDALFTFKTPVNEAKKSLFEGNHGISHNLFIGLGAVPNKFGLSWDDNVGAEVVRKVSPNTEYCSPEYFNILKNLYLEYLKENPLEVLRIYIHKLAICLKFLPCAVSLAVSLLFGLLYVLKFTVNWKGILPLLLISLVCTSYFILQGVMAHRNYLRPMTVATCIHLGLSLEWLLSYWPLKIRKRIAA